MAGYFFRYVAPKIAKNLTKKRNILDDLIKSRDKHLAGVRDKAKVEIKSKNPLSKFTKKIEKIVDQKATGGRVGKMGGGMMSRRMGYQDGSKKGKVPTTPKEKSLAKLAPPKDRITFGDVIAGRTKGKRMQAREGTLPLTKRNIKEGKPGKIKELPFGNMSEEKRKLKSQRKP